MKKGLKKWEKRLLAAVLSITMTVSLFSVSVSAANPPAPQQESFVSALFKSTRTVCLNKAVTWVLDGFMNTLFEPEDSAEVKLLKDIQEQMNSILANQQKIADELKSLESIVEVQSYLNIINEYMEALALCEPFFQCYDTLNSLDKTYEGQPDVLKIQRLRALTEGLNISEAQWTSANTSVDNKFLTLCSKFTGPITYSVAGQVISDGDLFDVYREIKRYQYCFENEAWDEMENFFDYAAYSFALISLIESASVQARIERCHIHNEGKEIIDPGYYSTASLETWLYNESGMAADSDLESRIQQGSAVYEGNRVVRQDVFRHFWKPGHEVLIYTKVTSLGSHPVDEPLAGKGKTSAGLNFKYTGGMRVKSEGEKAQPVDSFWNQFYNSAIYPEASLLTTDIINRMLQGSGHKMSIADIMKAGNFEYKNCSGMDDCIGLVLKKNDEQNPFKIDESHKGTWVEGLGTMYTDKIRVYSRYAPATQTNDIAKNGAPNYKTYYYYHTSDGPTKWYVEDEYTKGSLLQVHLCEDTCVHSHLQWIEDSGKEPTCTEEGEEPDFKCLDCGKVFIGEKLEKAPHTGGKWQNTSQKHWKICDVCKNEYAAGPHVCADPSVLITGLYICRDCGYMTSVSPYLLGWKVEDKDAPKTGDNSEINMYLLLSIISLGGAIFCGLCKKKKSRGE